MLEKRCFFPGKGLPYDPIVSLTIKTFIKSVKQGPVKNFVEAFKIFNILFESHWIFLAKTGRYFNNNALLLLFPDSIKDSIGNNHDISLFRVRVMTV